MVVDISPGWLDRCNVLVLSRGCATHLHAHQHTYAALVADNLSASTSSVLQNTLQLCGDCRIQLPESWEHRVRMAGTGSVHSLLEARAELHPVHQVCLMQQAPPAGQTMPV